MKRYLAPVGWALTMLVMILDGKTAMGGAADGLRICIQSLIPCLFPFFVLSAMLTGSLSGHGLLAAGILGGYPVGAANVARSFHAGQLRREEAERMIVLCNCAGPSFIFGVIGPVLGSVRLALAVWLSNLISVAVLWVIFPRSRPCSGVQQNLDLQQALLNAVRATAGVCGWVILFRTVIAVLNRWVLWLLPEWGQAVVHGILELCNGCMALGDLETGLRTILAAGFTGFGGFCVMLQTAGVADGISLKYYFPGKVFQCLVSMLAASLILPGTISAGVQCFLSLLAGLIAVTFLKLRKKFWKSSPDYSIIGLSHK